jgi:predicted nucleic acid-binding protein
LRTATGSTMTREVVLDANVIVALLEAADVLATRARELMQRLRDEGAELVLVDVTVTEALSVLCRRAARCSLDGSTLVELAPPS